MTIATHRSVKIVGILTVLVTIIFSIFWVHHDRTFVIRNFQAHTGVAVFIVKYQYHDDHETFIEVRIPIYEKRKLVDRFAFDSDLSELHGRVECSFISEDPRFVYHVMTEGNGPYGYVVLALEKDGNTLMVYDGFGN